MDLTTDDSKLIQPAGKIIEPARNESRPAPKPRSNASALAGTADAAGAPGHLVDADGRDLPEPPASVPSQLYAPLLGFAERNPKGAALLSLGVGLVAGAILGVVIKRD